MSIYLIQTPECKNTNIYKIGRTSKPTLTRMNGYPKGCKLIVTLPCSDEKKTEKRIVRLFDTKFTRESNGREYYSGNLRDMVNIIKDNVNLDNDEDDSELNTNEDKNGMEEDYDDYEDSDLIKEITEKEEQDSLNCILDKSIMSEDGIVRFLKDSSNIPECYTNKVVTKIVKSLGKYGRDLKKCILTYFNITGKFNDFVSSDMILSLYPFSLERDVEVLDWIVHIMAGLKEDFSLSTKSTKPYEMIYPSCYIMQPCEAVYVTRGLRIRDGYLTNFQKIQLVDKNDLNYLLNEFHRVYNMYLSRIGIMNKNNDTQADLFDIININELLTFIVEKTSCKKIQNSELAEKIGMYSYTLKHRLEVQKSGYVSNGECILAFFILGTPIFPVIRNDKRTSPNATIGTIYYQ